MGKNGKINHHLRSLYPSIYISQAEFFLFLFYFKFQMAAAAEFAGRHLTRGMKRMTDYVISSGKGSRVQTECGRDLLDFTTGIAVTNLGHCHPKGVEAVQEQAARVNHVQVNIALHRPMLSLVERLKDLTPPGLDSFFFWNSGAEAVEAAIKVARRVTGRGEVIVLDGSYHGRTLGTMPLTTSGTVYRGGFGPFMPGVHITPFQSCFRCPQGGSGNSAGDGCPADGCCGAHMDGLELLLRRSALGSDIAAVIVEPVQGEGGYIPAPKGYLEALRAKCDEIGAMLILDEIQSGAGRTAKWFALEHYEFCAKFASVFFFFVLFFFCFVFG
jgi:4-aminobutyrate aminotransferase